MIEINNKTTAYTDSKKFIGGTFLAPWMTEISDYSFEYALLLVLTIMSSISYVSTVCSIMNLISRV